jgi:twitching motility two-component system response regulator PilG
MAPPLIVFVNHNEALLRQAQLVLTREGFRVVVWGVGEGAEAMIEQENPDLVVLDLWLERAGSGWDLFEAIRGNPDIANVPIIITSEESEALEKRRPLISGDDNAVLFRKPYDWEVMLHTIKAMIAATPA